MTRPLLTACCLLALAASGAAQTAPPVADRLPEGAWTGAMTPMNHPEMEIPVAYEVSYPDGRLTIAISGPGGGELPTRDVTLEEDALGFVFDEPDAGIPLACAFARQPDGTFEGRCADADGKWAAFTMAPPAR